VRAAHRSRFIRHSSFVINMHPHLPRSFYRRDPETLAKALLGQKLVRVDNGGRLAGIIVETEAYLGIPDRAAHTFGGRRTPRVASMWKDGGQAYVYFTYGMHFCLNVVAGNEGEPVAVLLRALEPVEGLEAMRANRGFPEKQTALCSGPAKLCAALNIGREQDGLDLTSGETLFIERVRGRGYPANRIAVTPRVGVGYANEWADKPLRFYLRDNPHVSRK
jgi:DNA-3-methyladenine glycosylase